MQPGSLVTPRWPKDVAWVELTKLIGPLLAKVTIAVMPEYGQIYTVKRIANETEPPCVDRQCVLEELRVVNCRAARALDGGEAGLAVQFYVEIDPPQENVQAIVDSVCIPKRDIVEFV